MPHRAGHPRRVPPAAAARLRLPQGGHHRLPAVQGRLRLRPARRSGAAPGRRGRPARPESCRIRRTTATTGRKRRSAPARVRGRPVRRCSTPSPDSCAGAAEPVRWIWLPPLPAAVTLDGVAGAPETAATAGCGCPPRPAAWGTCRCRSACSTTPPSSGRALGARPHRRRRPRGRDRRPAVRQDARCCARWSPRSALTHSPRQVAVYGIDLPAPACGRWTGLPHVGGVADPHQPGAGPPHGRGGPGMLAHREEVFRQYGIDSLDRCARRTPRAACRSCRRRHLPGDRRLRRAARGLRGAGRPGRRAAAAAAAATASTWSRRCCAGTTSGSRPVRVRHPDRAAPERPGRLHDRPQAGRDASARTARPRPDRRASCSRRSRCRGSTAYRPMRT